ncbi:MAG: GNAT family N-acetyltransferase, partial [Chthoniobacterales bacterium]
QWENERHFYLKEMCVDSRKQRGGVGTRLLRQLMKTLRGERVHRISLGTERETPAERFYLRLGFATEARIVIMKRRLRVK